METPIPSAKTVEDVIILLGAKDDKEAIAVMYQALLLMEVYINRVVQYLLFSFYNSSKLNADKPISQFFDSDLNAITQMVQEYDRLSSFKRKKFDKNTIHEVNNNGMQEINEKYKNLQNQHELLKKKYEEISVKLAELNKINVVQKEKPQVVMAEQRETKITIDPDSVIEKLKLEKEITDLKERLQVLNTQLIEEKNAHEETVKTSKQNEIDIESLRSELEEIKALKKM